MVRNVSYGDEVLSNAAHKKRAMIETSGIFHLGEMVGAESLDLYYAVPGSGETAKPATAPMRNEICADRGNIARNTCMAGQVGGGMCERDVKWVGENVVFAPAVACAVGDDCAECHGTIEGNMTEATAQDVSSTPRRRETRHL